MTPPLVLTTAMVGSWVIFTVLVSVATASAPEGVLPSAVTILVTDPASIWACVRVAVAVPVVLWPGARVVVPRVMAPSALSVAVTPVSVILPSLVIV